MNHASGKPFLCEHALIAMCLLTISAETCSLTAQDGARRLHNVGLINCTRTTGFFASSCFKL